MKKCPNCEKELKKSWNYCPRCGTLVKNPMSIMFQEVKNRLKKSFNIFSPSSKAYEVDVQDSTRFKKREEIKETVELESEKKWVGNRLKIEARAPRVENLKDCKFNIFGESLEIRAYDGEKRFFKVIEIPEKMEIEKKEIEDNKIKISLR